MLPDFTRFGPDSRATLVSRPSYPANRGVASRTWVPLVPQTDTYEPAIRLPPIDIILFGKASLSAKLSKISKPRKQVVALSRMKKTIPRANRSHPSFEAICRTQAHIISEIHAGRETSLRWH